MIRTAIPALAAALLAGAALPASAQVAQYCDGHLSANAYYANVLSDGRHATVEYHGQIQNRDPQRRTITATVVRVQMIGSFPVIRMVGTFDLAPYEQKDINILAIRVNNPAGTGAPSAHDVGRQIRIHCAYR